MSLLSTSLLLNLKYLGINCSSRISRFTCCSTATCHHLRNPNFFFWHFSIHWSALLCCDSYLGQGIGYSTNCIGIGLTQSQAMWLPPLKLELVPAVILGDGMISCPYHPVGLSITTGRWGQTILVNLRGLGSSDPWVERVWGEYREGEISTTWEIKFMGLHQAGGKARRSISLMTNDTDNRLEWLQCYISLQVCHFKIQPNDSWLTTVHVSSNN